MFDNENNKYVRLESKICVKYLGVLVDQNLSWKYHIDSIVTKTSKNVKLVAKLCQSVPRPILPNIYKSESKAVECDNKFFNGSSKESFQKSYLQIAI